MNWTKGILQWRWNRVLYLSVVFTWDLPKAREIAAAYPRRVVAGGPACELVPDYMAEVAGTGQLPMSALGLHNSFACRTSRGCPRHCQFCINRHRPLELLPDFEARPLVCDDNLLACPWPHIERAIEKLACLPYVDFNQGLDARLFTEDVAVLLAELQHVKVRFAWDTPEQEKPVRQAIALCREHGLTDVSCYVLIGYPNTCDTPDYSEYRCMELRELGVRQNVQRFQPVRQVPLAGIELEHLLKKNSYVADWWTEGELRRHMKYWNRQAWLGGVKFDEFRPQEATT